MTGQPTSRRALLQGAALLAAVPVAAAVGEPGAAETPILRLFCQWEAILEQIDAACEAARGQGFEREDEMAASFDPERHRIEDAILAEPPTELRDLAIKVLVNSGEGCFGLDDPLALACAALAGRDFDQLSRCLFDKDAA